jgi:ParB family chromosome partitioning protein
VFRKVHVGNNAGDNEWYTPPEYLDAARKVLGTIDLDPASSDTAQERVQATTYFTEDDDGLSKPWAGRVFMNPPYAHPLVDQFTAKLAGHYAAGEVREAVVLVNNATDAQRFDALTGVARAVCFPLGRVKFLDKEGNEGAPLQGQAVLYLGNRVDRFLDAFSPLGKCWVR